MGTAARVEMCLRGACFAVSCVPAREAHLAGINMSCAKERWRAHWVDPEAAVPGRVTMRGAEAEAASGRNTRMVKGSGVCQSGLDTLKVLFFFFSKAQSPCPPPPFSFFLSTLFRVI